MPFHALPIVVLSMLVRLTKPLNPLFYHHYITCYPPIMLQPRLNARCIYPTLFHVFRALFCLARVCLFDLYTTKHCMRRQSDGPRRRQRVRRRARRRCFMRPMLRVRLADQDILAKARVRGACLQSAALTEQPQSSSTLSR